MQKLRTPDERFADLPGYPFAPHYTQVPDGEGGELRIHHVDEGPADAAPVLCMHGQPSWSYLYRHMIPRFAEAGLRVLAPDLPGYGRSDKPAALEDYSYQRQVDWMTSWLEANDLRRITFVGQDWGGLIGLRLVAENPERFDRVLIANTGLPQPEGVSSERADAVRAFRRSDKQLELSEVMQAIATADPEKPELAFAHWQKWCWDSVDLPVGPMITATIDGRAMTAEETAAYDAPFPDPSYKMGARAMPSQVPTLSDDPSLPAQRKAWKALEAFDKPFLCAFSNNDPVTAGADARFRNKVPGAKGQPHTTIDGGGHFLQEGRGEELARIAIDFIRKA